MRLARRALFAALTSLILVSAVTGQTLRPGNDPRNQSPSVGTGGPEGGPTGLFTIYDGDTIRKGEFTFSIAYSNYDRDPGKYINSIGRAALNTTVIEAARQYPNVRVHFNSRCTGVELETATAILQESDGER